jgi:hypothetical protein
MKKLISIFIFLNLFYFTVAQDKQDKVSLFITTFCEEIKADTIIKHEVVESTYEGTWWIKTVKSSHPL